MGSVGISDVPEAADATAARRLHRALLTLSRCNAAVARAHDEISLLDDVCDIAVNQGGYRMAWVGMMEHDPACTVRPVACAGCEDGYLLRTGFSWSENQEHGRGPTGRCLRTDTIVVAHNLQFEPAFEPWREQALRRGYASSISLPLHADASGVVGAMMIYAAEADAFDDEETDLLRQIADAVSFGLTSLRTRAERERMRSQLLFADRMAAMGTLAAGVAHEINNPLGYVLGNLDLLERDLSAPAAPGGAGSDRLRARLGQIRDGVERVRLIARDLKVFTRPAEEQCGSADLERVLEASINIAWNELRHRARLVRAFAGVPHVRGSEARLGQVFLNLIINAAQAIPEGNAEGHQISVVARSEETRVVVEISDTGVGVAPEHRARLFDPFFTTKPAGVGTGLGLSITREIVKALGGVIDVDSAPGRGSTFRVALLRAPLEHKPITTTPASQAGGRGASGSRRRILVVDDEVHLCEVICEALADHEVRSETDARRAMTALDRGERFDLILCDLMMPIMNGIELHDRIATLDPAQARRMVFMTGGAFTAAAEAFLCRNGSARLDKPFDLDDLFGAVARHLC